MRHIVAPFAGQQQALHDRPVVQRLTLDGITGNNLRRFFLLRNIELGSTGSTDH
jgi:hypothetical protein